MNHLKTFEGLSGDKLDKIKLLNNPGYYLNSINAEPVRFGEIKNLDLFFQLEGKIKEIFKGYKFDIVMNSFKKNLFVIEDGGDITISIVEMEDEYFYVVVKKIKRLSTHLISSDSSISFVADQTDGLIYLLTDIHKIINE